MQDQVISFNENNDRHKRSHTGDYAMLKRIFNKRDQDQRVDNELTRLRWHFEFDLQFILVDPLNPLKIDVVSQVLYLVAESFQRCSSIRYGALPVPVQCRSVGVVLAAS